MGKVLIDGVIFGLQRSGGISRFFADLIKGLDQAGHELILLLPNHRNVDMRAMIPHLRYAEILPRRRFRWGKRSLLWESLYLTEIAMRKRPAVWHSSYYVGFPKAFVGKRLLSFYDMIPEKMGGGNPYDKKMKEACLQQADQIVAISKNSGEDLLLAHPDLLSKISVIPLSLPDPHLAFTPYKKTFVYVGRREGYKNFLPIARKILLDGEFDEYQIRVIGGASDWSEEELKLVEQFPDRMVCLGTLPYEKVQSEIQSAAVLLYPSLYEGFGLPVLEAFHLGVPVFANRTSSIPEITGASYPLVDLKNPLDWKETLHQLLSERKQWVDYGKTRTTLFSSEKMVQRFIEVYERAQP